MNMKRVVVRMCGRQLFFLYAFERRMKIDTEEDVTLCKKDDKIEGGRNKG